MAISREDKKDVKNAMGKALANKVAKVTRDSNGYTKKQQRDSYGGNDMSVIAQNYEKTFGKPMPEHLKRMPL